MVETKTIKNAMTREQMQTPVAQTAGILVADLAYRRLLEGIVVNLELTPLILDEKDLASGDFLAFEMIIADEMVARRLRLLIKTEQGNGEGIKPALIAVVKASYKASSQDEDSSAFDGVVSLSENPVLLNAQLSVALYAYRAFATRYRTALEELNLNRNIFKSVTSGISVANAQLPDMPLLYVNPAFEVMTGYALEEIEGKNCRFLQNKDADQPGLTLIREALVQQRETTAVIKNYRKDGSFFWNELSLSPIRNREGVLTHFVGIQMDVTERVEFEVALREAEKLAAVGRLASAISHEINNPLAAIMNLVYLTGQTISQTADNEEARLYLAQADLELQRIKLITAQSLRFYKQSHNPEAVRAEELLGPILDVYKPRLVNSRTSVERRERSTQHVVCLASEIRQVLSNLITNAMDAMRSGNGTLYVRTREGRDWCVDKPGIVITIADTGQGMTPQTVRSIYKAFYTTKGANGTGLGLWISSEIVHRHRGHLHVRSQLGQGTVFQLFLPFQAASGEEAE